MIDYPDLLRRLRTERNVIRYDDPRVPTLNALIRDVKHLLETEREGIMLRHVECVNAGAGYEREGRDTPCRYVPANRGYWR